MFSSNQVLQISGDLEEKDSLYNALDFALKLQDINFCDKIKCVYQITPNNTYCIGWSFADNIKKGWAEFPFDFDVHIISQIISQYLHKQKAKTIMLNGEYSEGFVMTAIPEWHDKELHGIVNPFYGIVEFKPYTCFYSK